MRKPKETILNGVKIPIQKKDWDDFRVGEEIWILEQHEGSVGNIFTGPYLVMNTYTNMVYRPETGESFEIYPNDMDTPEEYYARVPYVFDKSSVIDTIWFKTQIETAFIAGANSERKLEQKQNIRYSAIKKKFNDFFYSYISQFITNFNKEGEESE